ncbi:MAG TPA: hypothetical protein PKA38_03230 [Candidatus Levybacteria bacterium]|nr:hypothetical protein [Candidatus Levybacteria bacterium]
MSSEFNQPDRFTDDDRRALSEKFSAPTYESTSDHADSYIRAHYKKSDQEKKYGDDRDWIRLNDIDNILTPEIYIENFIEECFRTPNDLPIQKEGTLVLNYFHKWKRLRQEDYHTLDSDASNQAADLIRDITIYDVCRHANSKVETYSSMAKNTHMNSSDTDFYQQKSTEWEKYSKILVEATKRNSRIHR